MTGANQGGASASVHMGDTWSTTGGGGATSGALHVKFDGTLDPLFFGGAAEPVNMRVSLRYAVGDIEFRFDAQYDSGILSDGMSAQLFDGLNTQDFTSSLAIAGNSVSFDKTFNWSAPGTWAETFFGQASIERLSSAPTSPHTLDFFHSFSAETYSLNPDVSFASEGRSVPEPSAAVLAIFLCMVVTARRRLRRAPSIAA